MAEDMRVMRLGAATVAIINGGDLRADLAGWLSKSKARWAPRYSAEFARTSRIPVQCIHVALNGMSLLVDPGRHALPDGSPFALPGYHPPPGLLERLAQRGVAPAEITHVVITHGHFDHYNGVTVERDGGDVPCFPNARHYLGRADWQDAEMQEALRDPASMPSRTLGVLHRQGLLELIEDDQDIGAGARIIVAPGESPGHQILRIQSEGQTLYCLGDLYHHPAEIEQAEWMVDWAAEVETLASRRALMRAALDEDALLLATHISAVGRVRRTANGVAWVEAWADSEPT